MVNEFTGKALALDTQGITLATRTLACSPAELWSVVSVETSGCGFLPDRRVQILYERHIFHRLTAGKYDADPDLSAPTPFPDYGPGGEHQYARLNKAAARDRPAALRATSWGLGQIMGENAKLAGYPDAESMVAAMMDSEAAQLQAVATFIRNTRLATTLTSHDWIGFAKAYNGPGYARNRYPEKLEAAFARYSTGPLPDTELRAAQLYLTFAGYQPGPVDGAMGTRTRTAILAFQRAKGMTETGKVDAALPAALLSSR